MRRLLFGVGVVIPALLLGYGYYLQYVGGLQPCPLCYIQRAFFYLVMAAFLVAAIHNPGRKGTIVYGAAALLFALGGAATAGRQLWLQSLPADKVPACGPDLFFMLDNFPLSRTLEKLFYGSGECAAIDWTFLGLSIAGWSFVWFLILGGYAVWIALRQRSASIAAAAPAP